MVGFNFEQMNHTLYKYFVNKRKAALRSLTSISRNSYAPLSNAGKLKGFCPLICYDVLDLLIISPLNFVTNIGKGIFKHYMENITKKS